MSDEKKFKVKLLKSINISGVPYEKDAVVMVHEKDARDLVLRKRVIALNFHIEYKRDINAVIVNEGLTKNQDEKLEEFTYKEEKKKGVAQKETETGKKGK